MVFHLFWDTLYCIWPRIESSARLRDKDLRSQRYNFSLYIFTFLLLVPFHTYFLEFNNKKFYFFRYA